MQCKGGPTIDDLGHRGSLEEHVRCVASMGMMTYLPGGDARNVGLPLLA
jgi:hypothetical protein